MALALKTDFLKNESPSVFMSMKTQWQAQTELATESYLGELAELRKQRDQLDHLINVMPAGVILLDGNGVVVKANQIASDLLEEPILGEAWFNVIQNSFKPREDDWHEVSLKDGRKVKLDIMPLAEQPGQLILITDLTETRLLQDKVAQMQRLSSLGRMVSTLAHQIRTPLSAAMLYGANLANQSISEQSRTSFQSKLMSRLQDLEQQVNDMLLFAKSGGKQVVQSLSVNNVITSALAEIEPQIQKSNAKLSINLCEQDCHLLGNKPALIGAIQNLINNSIEIIGTGAEINIASYCHKDDVYISIQDNGPGISEELKQTIFEPFVTAREKGTGLGLAVVKSVAKAHQGEVSLLNSEKGAHFCFRIPQFMNESNEISNPCGGLNEHK